MLTLKQLAQQAGVSTSTVSKALNNSPDISEETKRQIIELAEKNGYRKKYRKKSSSRPVVSGPKIGLVYYDGVSRYYSRLIQTYSEKLSSIGGVLIACDTQFSNERIATLFNYLDQQCHVDGIISIMGSCDLSAIPKTRAPIVCTVGVKAIDAIASGIYPFDFICLNSRTGIQQAVDYLVRNGHREIAYITEKHCSARNVIVEDVLAKAGVPLQEGYYRETSLRFEEAGYRMMKELLEEGKRPTAVICGYDDIAVGASRAILDAGLSIPEDISLIGYDDTRQRIYNNRTLASIGSFINDQVSIGMAMLMKRITGTTNAVQNVSLQTAFFPYDTVGPAEK